MNNLVFNTTAKNLKTALYAQAPDESFQPVQLNASNEIQVGGTMTVSEISSPITIANTSLTVAGTVTVSEITSPITIGNTSLTVAGTVTVSEVTSPITIGNTSLTVAGTVTVSEVTSPITIGNTSLTVAGTVTVSEITNPVTTIVSGNSFVEDTVAPVEITGSGVLFSDTDISTLKEASLFLYNQGPSTVTISLQFSPTTTDGDYMDDPEYTEQAILANENLFMTPSYFSHYIRLSYEMGASTSTVTAYFNGQA